MLAAREKAANLAQTLGSQIAEPLKIEEVPAQQIYNVPLYANKASFDEGGSTSPQSLALGQITISTNVKVIFKLKNP